MLRASLRILPLFLFVVSLPIRAGDPAAEDQLRKRLTAIIAKGDFRQALSIADKVIEDDDECIAAWQFRAYSLERLGFAQKAIDAYERTVDLDAGNGWAWANLANLLSDEGRLDRAVSAADRAVALNPAGKKEAEILSRVHRVRGEYAAAAGAVSRGLRSGLDPAWAHAELGYLYWVLQDLARSGTHWEKARAAGAHEEACTHGLALIAWDRPARVASIQAAIAHRRRGEGAEWVFDIGEIEVRTRVGPRLPREVERWISTLAKEYGKLLGAPEVSETRVRLHLSRTIEAHEVHREREFPDGYSEKAFLVPRWGRRPGRGGWRRGRRAPELDVYVAWSAPGLLRSISHELAHVILWLRCPNARELPVWLDEGLATYLELSSDERGRLGTGRVRQDLLDSLAEAEKEGTAFPLRMLISATRRGFVGENARVHYAQAWALAHFVMNASGRTAKLRKYLDAINSNRTPTPIATFQSVWAKDLESFEKAWKRHIQRITD